MGFSPSRLAATQSFAASASKRYAARRGLAGDERDEVADRRPVRFLGKIDLDEPVRILLLEGGDRGIFRVKDLCERFGERARPVLRRLQSQDRRDLVRNEAFSHESGLTHDAQNLQLSAAVMPARRNCATTGRPGRVFTPPWLAAAPAISFA